MLSTTAVTTVNAINAVTALRKAIALLHKKGIQEKLLIMSDVGTDFTSDLFQGCLLYTSPSPRDGLLSRMPSSA